jgi:hypothetical protein
MALVTACATSTPAPPAASVTIEPAPTAAPCPDGVPADARCLRGRDSAGAHLMIVVPAQWNGVLVVHAHGGPELGEPRAARADEDAKRWSILPRAGYAYAASVFRQGGVAVRSAAEDTERVRRIFVAHVGAPRRTILHGQSWGANVAAVGAEQYAAADGGRSPYHGVLLTSGVVGGGSRSYDFRLDLRVVYQALCGNHPAPGEPAYPMSIGLPPGATLTRAELAARADACLGLRTPAARRTPEQAQRLKTLVDVVRIPESSVLGHLNWATWHFQDIAQRSGGASPFGNERVRYAGSTDDAALNARVARYPADPQAAARLAADTDPTGRIPVPVLSVHAVDDPTAFVELQSVLRDTMQRAGSGDRLVQVFTGHAAHSYLADPVYVAALEALVRWIEQGARPTPESVAQGCAAAEASWGAGCRMLPDYRPAPLEARVPPR